MGAEELHPDNPEAVGYLERSLASAPVWQMGRGRSSSQVVRRDPRLLDFLVSAPTLARVSLSSTMLTWMITRWYQAGPTE